MTAVSYIFNDCSKDNENNTVFIWKTTVLPLVVLVGNLSLKDGPKMPGVIHFDVHSH